MSDPHPLMHVVGELPPPELALLAGVGVVGRVRKGAARLWGGRGPYTWPAWPPLQLQLPWAL